ncbi:hypothetical protein MMC11_004514 [Xylographa trunciseda]|nr:hypothetical protein [Xylographa trunciseda]
MRLRHLHLPFLTPYTHASHLQAILVRHHLDHKALPRPLRLSTPAPPPTILTFQTHPTYTCGRREISTITPEQIAYLRADGTAEFHPALRGGQTTYHGPGQLTGYVILALDTHGLKPAKFVRFLEDSVIETCREYGITGFTTENPGVWTSEEDKIASVGVHLRRNVASHGVGLNVTTDLKWFDRIVACGLVGKRATSLEKEGMEGANVDDVAKVLAQCMAERLKCVDGVKKIKEEEVLALQNEGGEGMHKVEHTVDLAALSRQTW